MVALKLYGCYKHKLIIKQPGEIFFEYRYKKKSRNTLFMRNKRNPYGRILLSGIVKILRRCAKKERIDLVF